MSNPRETKRQLHVSYYFDRLGTPASEVLRTCGVVAEIRGTLLGGPYFQGILLFGDLYWRVPYVRKPPQRQAQGGIVFFFFSPTPRFELPRSPRKFTPLHGAAPAAHPHRAPASEPPAASAPAASAASSTSGSSPSTARESRQAPGEGQDAAQREKRGVQQAQLNTNRA